MAILRICRERKDIKRAVKASWILKGKLDTSALNLLLGAADTPSDADALWRTVAIGERISPDMESYEHMLRCGSTSFGVKQAVRWFRHTNRGPSAWNGMARVWLKTDRPGRAFELLQEMRGLSIPVYPETETSVWAGLARIGRWADVLRVVENSHRGPTHLKRLVAGLIRAEKWGIAHELLQDLDGYRGMHLRVYSAIGDTREALLQWENMLNLAQRVDVNLGANVLLDIGNSGNLSLALALADQMAAYGMGSNQRVIRAILEVASKAERLDLATDWFRRMDHPNVRTYNVMIELLGQFDSLSSALKLSSQLDVVGLKFDLGTFKSLLRCCVLHKDYPMACNLFNTMLLDFTPDAYVIGCMLKVCRESDHTGHAWKLFEYMRTLAISPTLFTYQQVLLMFDSDSNFNWAMTIFKGMSSHNITPDLVCYNTMIRLCNRKKNFSEARELYSQLQDNGVQPDIYTFNSLIACCVHEKQLDEALQLFSSMSVYGVTPDRVTFNTLITLCDRSGKHAGALKLYSDMKSRNIQSDSVTYTSSISSALNDNNLAYSVTLMDHMLDNTFELDALAYTAMLRSCAKSGLFYSALDIVEDMVSRGDVSPDTYHINTLLSACVSHGHLTSAVSIFSDMKTSTKYFPDLTTYNVMINNCSKHGMAQEGSHLLSELLSRGLRPDSYTMGALFRCCASMMHYSHLVDFFSILREHKVVPSEHLYTSILQACIRCGDFKSVDRVSQEFFQSNLEPSIHVYNTLIRICEKTGQCQQAFDLLTEMRSEMIAPDVFTFTSLIRLCSEFGRFEEAMSYFSEAKSRSLQDSYLYGSVLIACERSCEYKRAFSVFRDMLEARILPEITVYSTMIRIAAKSRQFDFAVQLFAKIQQDGLTPDTVAWNALLEACMLSKRYTDLGKFFLQMQTNGVVPDSFSFDFAIYAANHRGDTTTATKLGTQRDRLEL